MSAISFSYASGGMVMTPYDKLFVRLSRVQDEEGSDRRLYVEIAEEFERKQLTRSFGRLGQFHQVRKTVKQDASKTLYRNEMIDSYVASHHKASASPVRRSSSGTAGLEPRSPGILSSLRTKKAQSMNPVPTSSANKPMKATQLAKLEYSRASFSRMKRMEKELEEQQEYEMELINSLSGSGQLGSGGAHSWRDGLSESGTGNFHRALQGLSSPTSKKNKGKQSRTTAYSPGSSSSHLNNSITASSVSSPEGKPRLLSPLSQTSSSGQPKPSPAELDDLDREVKAKAQIAVRERKKQAGSSEPILDGWEQDQATRLVEKVQQQEREEEQRRREAEAPPASQNDGVDTGVGAEFSDDEDDDETDEVNAEHHKENSEETQAMEHAPAGTDAKSSQHDATPTEPALHSEPTAAEEKESDAAPTFTDDQEAKAVNIQCAWRQRQARQTVYEKKSKRRADVQAANEAELEEMSAQVIQRRAKAKYAKKDSNSDAEATTVFETAYTDKHDAAALKIQCAWRQEAARQKVFAMKSKRRADVEAANEAELEEMSAQVIQRRVKAKYGKEETGTTTAEPASTDNALAGNTDTEEQEAKADHDESGEEA